MTSCPRSTATSRSASRPVISRGGIRRADDERSNPAGWAAEAVMGHPSSAKTSPIPPTGTHRSSRTLEGATR
ncbi:MAG: hypothetical protein M0C28_44280 [Candidatus Moduliflexus flocculans]|nr:hypothetical protein [Candidatus Moduliflexus flocculans]